MTDEQLAYRASLLKKRTYKKREQPQSPIDPILYRIYFLNNCNKWLQGYKSGEIDTEELKKTIKAMDDHILVLKKLLL